MRGYQPKYFQTHELVSQRCYRQRGEKAIQLLDNRALMTLDALREQFGPLTVNNWYWGGERQFSGLRQPGDEHFKPSSQHTSGRAFDFISERFSAAEMRAYIIKHREQFPMITCLEGKISWLHFDVRNLEADAGPDAIMLVYPNNPNREYI